ncbi:MAG: adenosylcobinamide-GDP ribazoletransferase [Spirochaetaceae bacterium]|jgi:adenosylcobinamide-GDP ribazoletransferase|nr:adenosylcobinamide-GDP ribazoletransferase [Spirochaetaceae bacterium]
MWDRFFSTLSLTSRIPLKVRFSFDPSWIDFYFPLVGIFPALLGALVFFLGSQLGGSGLITVLLALLVQYLGFNLFHLDGLADTADAFLGNLDREKRLAILKDPRMGVYGFFACFFILALKIALLYRIFPLISRFPASLLAYPLSGRLCAVLIPVISKPLKPDGLGALVRTSRLWRVLTGALIGFGLWTALVYGSLSLYGFFNAPPAVALPLPSLLLFGLPLLSPLVSCFLAWQYQKHLGGYSGDALGAAVELGEVLHLGGAAGLLTVLGV